MWNPKVIKSLRSHPVWNATFCNSQKMSSLHAHITVFFLSCFHTNTYTTCNSRTTTLNQFRSVPALHSNGSSKTHCFPNGDTQLSAQFSWTHLLSSQETQSQSRVRANCPTMHVYWSYKQTPVSHFSCKGATAELFCFRMPKLEIEEELQLFLFSYFCSFF